jgi:hypothetical protein
MAVLLGGRPGAGNTPVPKVAEGRVIAVSAAGMTFKIPAWDRGKFAFGPAPYMKSQVATADVGDHGVHDHLATEPVAGDYCLVVRVEGPVEAVKYRWWVVAWWSA